MRHLLAIGILFLVAGCAGENRMTKAERNLPDGRSSDRDLPTRLREDVTAIATTIGPRDLVSDPEALETCARWIETRFATATGRQVIRESFAVGSKSARNVYVDVPGITAPEEIVIVGAHYDSIPGCPAANDNGSGIAATLELARHFGKRQYARTVRYIAFVNEEPPYFLSSTMGSVVHAAGCRSRGEKIAGMISLETIGYFSDLPGSQRYPAPGLEELFPSTGNFIALVGNAKQQAFVDRVGNAMKAGNHIPVQSASVPAELAGVGWSDHWSFWQQGYNAAMVTDTAPFRYPHYHKKTDTPDKIDYVRFAGVVGAVADAVVDLAERP